ncbi:MAG: hypothetical protein ACKO9D_01005 [Gammaproteobacteria bacterium]
MKRRIPMLVMMLMVATISTACVAAPPTATAKPAATAPNATIDLYKGLGRKQCETGGGTLDTLRAQLTRAGVTPTAAACGTDGMMRVAMCGAGTGDIGIFTVRKSDAARAARIGFRPLSDLRDAERTACPGDAPKNTKK